MPFFQPPDIPNTPEPDSPGSKPGYFYGFPIQQSPPRPINPPQTPPPPPSKPKITLSPENQKLVDRIDAITSRTLMAQSDHLAYSKKQAELMRNHLDQLRQIRSDSLEELKLKKEALILLKSEEALRKKMMDTMKLSGKQMSEQLKKTSLFTPGPKGGKSKGTLHTNIGDIPLEKVEELFDRVNVPEGKMKAAAAKVRGKIKTIQGGTWPEERSALQNIDPGLMGEDKKLFNAVKDVLNASSQEKLTMTDTMSRLGGRPGGRGRFSLGSDGGDEGGPGGINVKQALGHLGNFATTFHPQYAMDALKSLGMAGKFIPVLGSALGVEKYGEKALKDLRDTRSLGQITGEGAGAGFAAKFEAFKLGANPFDMISSELAMQIIKAVRNAGFHGKLAETMDAAITDRVDQLGITVDQAVALFDDGYRKMNLSIKEISTSMQTFASEAKSANMSVQEFTTRVTSAANIAASGGAGKGSIQFGKEITQVFDKPWGQDEGINLLKNNTVFQNLLTQRLGLPNPAQIWPLVQTNTGRVKVERGMADIFDQDVQIVKHMKGSDTLEGLAANLSAYGLVFKGTPVPNIVAYLKKEKAGFGLRDTATYDEIKNKYQSDFGKVRGKGYTEAQLRKLVSSGKLDAAHMKDLHTELYRDFSKGKVRTAQRLVLDKGSVPDGWMRGPDGKLYDLRAIDQNKIVALRKQMFTSLKNETALSDKQLKDIQKNWANSGYNPSKLFETIWRTAGAQDPAKAALLAKKRGATVNATGGDVVTLVFDKSTKQWIMEVMSQGRKNAEAAGAATRNSDPFWNPRSTP